MDAIPRTSAGLRDLLFEQIEGVRSGTIATANAKAVAHLAGTIIKSVEVEMTFRQQQVELRKKGEPEALGTLQLSSLPAQEPEVEPENILKNTVAEEEIPEKPRAQLPDIQKREIPQHLIQQGRTVRGNRY